MTNQDVELDEILARFAGYFNLSLDRQGTYTRGEAKQALLAWSDKRVLEARIDEVKQLLDKSVEYYHQFDNPKRVQHKIHEAVNKPLLDRLAQLRNNINSHNSVLEGKQKQTKKEDKFPRTETWSRK